MRAADSWQAYRLRWKRRRLLFRIWRKRRQITALSDKTARIAPGAILCFATMRNEMLRLPWFLQHYRGLGVDHFLIVDNGSDDGTAAYLTDQPDVSVWTTPHPYRLARFGMDWVGWLLWRYGHGHWCLTVDADELLIYPESDRRDLKTLTGWLDAQGLPSFGALMLELYPKGPVAAQRYVPGTDPAQVLCWYDPDTYRMQQHPTYGNLWIQGGPRDRVFFAEEPARAPTLNKTPLVRWHWRYAYVSSTHQILPRHLHDVFDFAGNSRPSGVLLHTKFLPDIGDKSAEELLRRQHFAHPEMKAAYHQALTGNPDLWYPGAARYEGGETLVRQGLMTTGNWA